MDPSELEVARLRKGAKEEYKFWQTQPVAQFNGDAAGLGDGPIDASKAVTDVRQEPYNLQDAFEWCLCDLLDEAVCTEVYDLLRLNYVEDDDEMFRFCYSKEFIRWALCPPGFRMEWHVGVRVKASGKLVSFISGVPANIVVNGRSVQMVEINYLCVHKKLRSKRLAPLLIKEITRRVNLFDIWQAAYTAGVVLPKPIATCRYWHRSINPKKLIDVEFSRLSERSTMARVIKLNKLPDAPLTPGFRELEPRDIPQVTTLLNTYLEGFKLRQVFSEDEVRHWLVPRDRLIHAYVVEGADGAVTDVCSFYCLPSSILHHPRHTELKAAYMYYTACSVTPIRTLLNDALIKARDLDFDVFNALDILENSVEMLKDLKFGIGDGNLHFYLYNWRLEHQLEPKDVGLILM